MKNPFVILLMFVLYIQCNAQIHNSNYLDSLNKTRAKVLWFVHFPDSSVVSTYNLIFLRENVAKVTVQRLNIQRKLHPMAYAVDDVYPKSNVKFLNLKELCLKFKIPLKKMELPIFVYVADEMIFDQYEEMILDPKDIIIDSSIIKEVKIEHNKKIDKDVIQIIIKYETEEFKNHREMREHPYIRIR
ncbi:MAG: hypothetical protein Q8908_11315 [Bacteroidota bacterium]|nr:hypothetical protein [Bacteroidota bacterium]